MFEIIKDGGVTTPLGFQSATCVADIKGKGNGRVDLGLIVSDVNCNVAAQFTKNLVVAAPVIYCKEILKKSDKIRAIIASAGNANASTGVAGIAACDKIIEELSEKLNCKKENLLIASTGVIGVQLPYMKIVDKLDYLLENLSDENGEEFAKAILTTDTIKKEVAVLVETKSGSYCIGGACKGSGMIAPSLATMLTFITSDAAINKTLLNKALQISTKTTFDCVTVDGDMSTNDSVFVLANGMSGVKITDEEFSVFTEALTFVCLTLAKMMAKDGEGATKFVTINVKGAKSEQEARLCASKIANSPLVKTMFAGCDPNWGRLMASAGASGAIFDPNKTDIYFNSLHYVQNGIIIDSALEKEVAKIMQGAEYEITLDLHAGDSFATFYTCDLTAGYIKINADYRS